MRQELTDRCLVEGMTSRVILDFGTGGPSAHAGSKPPCMSRLGVVPGPFRFRNAAQEGCPSRVPTWPRQSLDVDNRGADWPCPRELIRPRFGIGHSGFDPKL